MKTLFLGACARRTANKRKVEVFVIFLYLNFCLDIKKKHMKEDNDEGNEEKSQ